jgi:hypothetical protein
MIGQQRPFSGSLESHRKILEGRSRSLDFLRT